MTDTHNAAADRFAPALELATWNTVLDLLEAARGFHAVMIETSTDAEKLAYHRRYRAAAEASHTALLDALAVAVDAEADAPLGTGPRIDWRGWHEQCLELRTVWNRGADTVRTFAMFEGAANDVAVYGAAGNHDATTVLNLGMKLSERAAQKQGFAIPEGKHYRR